MAISVPRNRLAAPRMVVEPPPPEFLAMAAAEQHAEGRLVEPRPMGNIIVDDVIPLASFGGLSPMEAREPSLRPDKNELNRREREFERQRAK